MGVLWPSEWLAPGYASEYTVAAEHEDANEMPDPPDGAQADDFGSLDEDITTAVDVTDVIEQNKAAMAAHGSQIDEASFFLAMPDEAFGVAFGT